MRRIATALTVTIALTGCKDDIESQLAALQEARDARIAKVKQISDPAARDTFGFMTSMLYQIQAGYIESRRPYTDGTQYTQPTLRRLQDYGSPVDMAQTFAGSLWAKLDFTQAVDVEEPFAFPLQHELVWERITLSDGTVLPISRDYDPESNEIQAIDTNFDYRVIYNSDGGLPEGAALPASIAGQFNTMLPSAVLTVTFDASNAGDTQDIGNYSVKLVEAEDHLAVVEISNSDGTAVTLDSDHVIVEAMDETGGYLDSFGSSWGNPEQLQNALAAFDELIQAAVDGTIDDFSDDAIEAEMLARAGLDMQEKLHGQIGFRGSIDKVEITLMPPGDLAYTETVTLPALAFSGQIEGPNIPEIPVTGTVYDHARAAFLDNTPVDIDPSDINTAIVAEHDNFRDSVRFNYPDVVSNLFVDAFRRYDEDAGDAFAMFFDASGDRIIATDPDAFDLTVNRVEFDPALFPTPPARVTGQFPVLIMSDIGREVFEPDTDPDALTIVGNQVRVDRNQFRNWDGNHEVLARDASGQLLKTITIQGVSSDDDRRLQVHYFYGDVARVELLKSGPTEMVLYNFDAAIDLSE